MIDSADIQAFFGSDPFAGQEALDKLAALGPSVLVARI
jgi:hypothetical protein